MSCLQKAMTALKAERELLEQQYRQALAADGATGSPTASDGAISESRLQDTGVQNVSELAERFMELSVARDELRRENQGLKSAVARYFTMQRKVLQSIEDLDVGSSNTLVTGRRSSPLTHATWGHSSSTDLLLTLWYFLVAQNESDLQVHQLIANDGDGPLSPSTLAQHLERVTLTKPLTSEECAELNRKACDEMQELPSTRNSGGGGVSEGTSLCGWQEYRNASSDRIRFSIEKLFPAHSAIELVSKTWDIVSSAAQFQEMYSANIGIQIDVLQHVDDDNVLIYRTTQVPDSARASKALLLLSRVSCVLGTGVLVRSVDRSRVQPVDPSSSWFDDEVPSSWSDTFLWSLFKEVGERREHCMVEIGGVVATTMATEFWMLEVLLMSLRWENRVVGPVFTAL